jgi:hypothetical protein
MALDICVSPMSRTFLSNDQPLPVLAQTSAQRGLAASTLSQVIVGPCEVELVSGETQWIARVAEGASNAVRDAALVASGRKLFANTPRQFLIPEGRWCLCWIAA